MDALWITRGFVIAASGAAGAVCRWLLGQAAQRAWPQSAGALLPLGVLAPNLIGCFAFGAIFGALHHRLPGDSLVASAIFTGFLGAFTTFSTFAFDLTETARDRSSFAAITAAALHVGLGVAAAAAGLWVAGGPKS